MDDQNKVLLVSTTAGVCSRLKPDHVSLIQTFGLIKLVWSVEISVKQLLVRVNSRESERNSVFTSPESV